MLVTKKRIPNATGQPTTDEKLKTVRRLCYGNVRHSAKTTVIPDSLGVLYERNHCTNVANAKRRHAIFKAGDTCSFKELMLDLSGIAGLDIIDFDSLGLCTDKAVGANIEICS